MPELETLPAGSRARGCACGVVVHTMVHMVARMDRILAAALGRRSSQVSYLVRMAVAMAAEAPALLIAQAGGA